MTKFSGFLEGIFGAAGGVIGAIFIITYSVGGIYWFWMSIQLGSFWMFFLGAAGPIVIFTAPIGMYSLIFGTPTWIFNMFG